MPTPPTSTPWVPMYGMASAPAAVLTFRGDWVAGSYVDGDVVVKDGVAYLCMGGPTAVAPDSAPWGLSTVLAYGTSLPASPIDGQEYVLVDSTVNPSYQWRFRYNAGSTSPYKWEFIGGPPWTGYDAPTLTTPTTAAWFGMAPSFATPRAGEWYAQAGASMSAGTAGAIIYFAIESAPGNLQHNSTAGGYWYPTSFSARAVVGAGAQIRPQGYAAGGVANYAQRQLSVWPVRVA